MFEKTNMVVTKSPIRGDDMVAPAFMPGVKRVEEIQADLLPPKKGSTLYRPHASTSSASG